VESLNRRGDVYGGMGDGPRFQIRFNVVLRNSGIKAFTNMLGHGREGKEGKQEGASPLSMVTFNGQLLDF